MRLLRADVVTHQIFGGYAARMGDNITDQQLVERVQRGDKNAYNLLVIKYQHKVANLVSRYVSNPGDVPDVAQEAFIKAWSQAHYGHAPSISPEQLDWREIEVRCDAYGSIQLAFHGRVHQALEESFGRGFPQPQLSISHDGDYATAHCLIQLLV